jgi:hypothetical protein
MIARRSKALPYDFGAPREYSLAMQWNSYTRSAFAQWLSDASAGAGTNTGSDSSRPNWHVFMIHVALALDVAGGSRGRPGPTDFSCFCEPACGPFRSKGGRSH